MLRRGARAGQRPPPGHVAPIEPDAVVLCATRAQAQRINHFAVEAEGEDFVAVLPVWVEETVRCDAARKLSSPRTRMVGTS